MPKKPIDVLGYLKDGCGRCPLGGTAECKVHDWQAELITLRQLMLQSGLDEQIKWGVPCYSHMGKNIAVVAALKDHCSLSFFKGSGLDDPDTILERPGQNTQAARLIRFTSVSQIRKLKAKIAAFVQAAIELEKTGYKPPSLTPTQMVWPSELIKMFESDSRFREAFNSLTPGRQRGYLLFFNAAKQPKTRNERIEKNRDRILDGLGLHD